MNNITRKFGLTLMVLFLFSSIIILAGCDDGGSSKGSHVYATVGTGGVMYYSSDAVTWKPAVSGTILTNLNDVACNGSVFCAVGVGGNILYSSDGKNWDGTTYMGLNDFNGVDTNGSLICAVGEDGIILYSENNCINWNSPTVAGPVTNLNAVCWTGSHFCTVGDNGLVRTSPDGKTWTTKAATPGAPMNIDVTYRDLGNGVEQFIVLASDQSVFISEDFGSTWSELNPDVGMLIPGGISSNGSQIVIAGLENMDGGRVYNSTTLFTWTLVWEDTVDTHALFAVDYIGGRFMAVGANGTLAVSIDSTASDWEYREVAATAQTLTGIAIK